MAIALLIVVWEKAFVRKTVIAAMTLSALLGSVADALANDPDTESGADVMTRARPEYDARGIRAGSFFLYPSITGGFGFTDNVFNDSSNLSDYFYSLNPQIKFQSAWARHALNAAIESKSYWYADQASENRTDWSFAGDARFDIERGTDVKVDAHLRREHEPRGTDLTGGLVPGDPAEPTELSDSGLGVEFDHTINRVRLSLGFSLDQIDYQDTPRVQPALTPTFNNDDRDRTVTEVFVRTDIEVTEDTGVFVRGRYSQHNFKTAVDDDGFNRDSTSVGLDGGVAFSMTHILVGELFAGYTQRSYDDPAFADTDELGFGAGLKWFPTMLTTVSLDGARTIEDTSIAAASGYISTRGQLGVDHELLRNVILSGRLGYENADYQDVGRNDDILRTGLSGRFLLNSNMHFDAGWEYIDRSSSLLPFDYSTGQFSLSLTGKL